MVDVHAWITYGMLRRIVLAISKLYGACEKYQETCPFACLWDPYGSLAMLGSCRVVIATTDHITHGMASHV